VSASGGGPFSRRAAAALAAVAAVSLGAAAFLGIFGDELSTPPSYGADGFSRSAIGHGAFVELLRDLGYPVIVSRSRTAEKGAGDAVLALLEPDIEREGEGPRAGLFSDMYEQAPRLLLVLPKRTGFPDPKRPRWLGMADLLPLEDVQRVLDALEIDASVLRPAEPLGAWKGDLPAPALDAPQLLRSEELAPVLSTDAGMLVGELSGEDWQVLVVSDPDLLAAHGLGRGDNAVLALALLDRLGANPRPVVIDETLHGHGIEPSIARELFRFPLLLATVQALAAAGLLAWAALVRFGRPARPPRALAPGLAFLVDHTAGLLLQGGHVGTALAAQLRAAKEAIAHRLRPPGDLADSPDAWLARTAAARGRAEALAALEARVRALRDAGRGRGEDALHVARAIHAFRREMTDGAPGDP
jgi:hypothetical protein